MTSLGPTTIPSPFAVHLFANYTAYLNDALGNGNHEIYIKKICYLLAAFARRELKSIVLLSLEIWHHQTKGILSA